MQEALLLKLIERDAAKGGLPLKDRNRKTKSLPLQPIKRDWSMSASYSAIQWEAA